MDVFPQLRKPPIQEAIVDFACTAKTPAEQWLAHLDQHFARSHPHRQDLRAFQASFALKGGSPSSTAVDTGLHGRRYEDQNRRDIVQCRRDGFTHNVLPPYPGLDTILRSTHDQWDAYRTATGVTILDRIALRFINRIPRTSMGFSFEDVLRTPLSVPRGLPASLSEYYCTLTTFDPATHDRVRITQLIEAAPTNMAVAGGEETITLILDIEAFSAEPATAGWQALEPILHRLRIAKNHGFFSTLTDKAIEAFR